MWSNLLPVAQKDDRLEATKVEIPSDVFDVSGQVHLDTLALDLERVTVEIERYDDVAVNGPRLSLEAIRKRTNEFTYWQRSKRTGKAIVVTLAMLCWLSMCAVIIVLGGGA